MILSALFFLGAAHQAPTPTLAQAKQALAPRLLPMLSHVNAQANGLGWSGWPTFEGLEAAERETVPDLYALQPDHAVEHGGASSQNRLQAQIWDNPRVVWFQDRDRWDAALLMPDAHGLLHLGYLEDAFGICRLTDAAYPEYTIDGEMRRDWVFKNSDPNNLEVGPDYADGPGGPTFVRVPQEGLVPLLGDVFPDVSPPNELPFDGFTLRREDLKGARPVSFGGGVRYKIRGRWWFCPQELWSWIAKACHLPEKP